MVTILDASYLQQVKRAMWDHSSSDFLTITPNEVGTVPVLDLATPLECLAEFIPR